MRPFTDDAQYQLVSEWGVTGLRIISQSLDAVAGVAMVLPIIGKLKRAGARTLREIAEALNARGVQTARGGEWYATTVRNVLARG